MLKRFYRYLVKIKHSLEIKPESCVGLEAWQEYLIRQNAHKVYLHYLILYADSYRYYKDISSSNDTLQNRHSL